MATMNTEAVGIITRYTVRPTPVQALRYWYFPQELQRPDERTSCSS